jgi:ABC-type histidine transport system ATPase subunit
VKAHLLFADADLDTTAELPSQARDVIADLGLNVVIDTMAGADAGLREIVTAVLLRPLSDPRAVAHRQQVLADCLAAPDVAAGLYRIARDTLEGEKRVDRWFFMRRPEPLLHRSVTVLGLLLERLRELRAFATEHIDRVRSPGLTGLFATLRTELDDAYLAEVEHRIDQLRVDGAMLVSARLGPENESVELVLRELPQQRRGLVRRPVVKKPSYSYVIPDRDEAGTRALSDLRDRVLDEAANAAAQSADHVLSFFTALRDEMSFYLAAMRLHEALTGLGVRVCLPRVLPADHPTHRATGLVDPALALASHAAPTGSDLQADGTQLVVITGANRGGKSTFLRAFGTAALMAGAGLFVKAEEFTTSLHSGVFCHFRREEDAELRSGKLDEELRRMRAIAGVIQPGALLLCNESFSATNEAEGSELARQVVSALTEVGVTVCYVTHLYDFAHGVASSGRPPAVFLRAERGESGQRPFVLVPGEPLPTSYGADVFRRVFGTDPRGLPAESGS